MIICIIMVVTLLLTIGLAMLSHLYCERQHINNNLVEYCNIGYKNRIISMSWKEFKKLYHFFPENFAYRESPNSFMNQKTLFYVKESSEQEKNFMEAHNEKVKFVGLNNDTDHVYIPIYFESFFDYLCYQHWVNQYEKFQEKIKKNKIRQEQNNFKLLMLDDLYKKNCKTN